MHRRSCQRCCNERGHAVMQPTCGLGVRRKAYSTPVKDGLKKMRSVQICITWRGQANRHEADSRQRTSRKLSRRLTTYRSKYLNPIKEAWNLSKRWRLLWHHTRRYIRTSRRRLYYRRAPLYSRRLQSPPSLPHLITVNIFRQNTTIIPLNPTQFFRAYSMFRVSLLFVNPFFTTDMKFSLDFSRNVTPPNDEGFLYTIWVI
jgi:hypothetical protein